MYYKVLQTADWHIGSFHGPEENGLNLRSADTLKCLDELVRIAKQEKPDLILVSGDIFHKAEIWQGRSHKEVLQARRIILTLAEAADHVVVMRGTPNYDSAEAFDELRAHFEFVGNVEIVTTPEVIRTDKFDIAVLPGFDRGVFRAKYPGLSKEDENKVFTHELSNIVLGLKAQCDPDKKAVLMSHYTVPGCNTESGQMMLLTQFEPVLPAECLVSADYDLVALGHIHRPQKLPNINNCFYAGAVNAMNFNDEGQERGFWIHNYVESDTGENALVYKDSQFFKTPYREFITFHFTDTDITAINLGNYDEIAFNYWRSNGALVGKIVRIIYSCSYKNSKALNKALLEKALLEDGAFMVWEILPENISAVADRSNMSGRTDPEENLRKYLEEKQYPEEKIQELVLKARPVIAEAEAGISHAAATGAFVPVEIEVKNYRNYEEEKFSFEDISFCTINGQNGAGKSSLFMDAIVDCLYEKPREGNKTPVKVPWLRNDEKARSGYIMFTFKIGEKIFRVTRTRARSGKITLNLSEFVDGEWTNRSKERADDTQAEIINIIGMDSQMFKSCALIMQDQYGLFLESPSEERMQMLGNLLGLGIYQAMEKIAWDKAKVFGAKARDLKHEISIHETTIKGYGEPSAMIQTLSEELADKETMLKAKTEERDRNRLVLTHQQEAAERRNKLLVSVRTLESKKNAAEQNKAAQQEIIKTSTAVLDGRKEIECKVAEYNSLVEREKEISTEAALYSSKQTEAGELEKQARYEEVQLSDLKTQLQSVKNKKAALEVPVDESIIRERNAEYEKYSELFRQAKELQTKFMEAKSERDRRAYAVDSKKAYINQETARLNSRKADLERRTELLQNAGCLDIDNAECRFLSDALDAKKQLPAAEAQISSFQKEQELLLQELAASLNEAEKVVSDIGYDEQTLSVYSAKVRELSEMKIGALKQKSEQIDQLTAEINVLRKKKNEAAWETADYDILKAAFSQDGIPHQIIRSIIPQLTATANNILGQITRLTTTSS